MTREQRLELLKQIEKDIYVPSIESTFLDDAKSCAIHSVIEELEQKHVIDKIRAEIDNIEINGYVRDVECFNMGIRYALNIIDKYKAEMEK